MRGFTVSIEQHHHDSFDGTRIAWYRAGTGPRRMAIASGLGTPILAWKHVVARLAQLDLGPKLMHRIGLVRGNPEFFGQIAREFSSLDWPTFFRLLQRLDEHSAAPLLSSIRVPTLVTAGSHDRMTPVATAEALHRGILGAEIFLIPGGTHYALVEYPELLNLRLGRFLDRVEARSAA